MSTPEPQHLWPTRAQAARCNATDRCDPGLRGHVIDLTLAADATLSVAKCHGTHPRSMQLVEQPHQDAQATAGEGIWFPALCLLVHWILNIPQVKIENLPAVPSERSTP